MDTELIGYVLFKTISIHTRTHRTALNHLAEREESIKSMTWKQFNQHQIYTNSNEGSCAFKQKITNEKKTCLIPFRIDTRTKGMLFVDSPTPTILLTLGYLLIVWIGPKIMRK